MHKVKVFAPLLITALLASCQQATTPQVAQSQVAHNQVAQNQGEQTQALGAQTDAGLSSASADTVSALDVTGDEGAVSAVPDPSYAGGTGTDLRRPQLPNPWPSVSQGQQGKDVQAVQYLLNARGAALDVDGTFGPVTLSAVKAFQKRSGLTADGVVGAQTWRKLVMDVRENSTGNAVKAVQNYLDIDVDGNFGPATLGAVRAFQNRNNLTATGLVGEQTWHALVAGTSDVGGTPPPSDERGKILARGKTWVDAKVPYSQAKYYGGWRTDCSGFVSMAWNLRGSKGEKLNENAATIWSYAHELHNPLELQPGDAVDSAENQVWTGHNHIVLFVKWVDKSKLIFQDYEEHGTADGTIINTRQLYWTGKVWNIRGSGHTSWHFLRRKNL